MKTSSMNLAAKVKLAALALVVMVPTARAYEQYSLTRTAGNCADCHGDFRAAPYVSPKGEVWTTNLHDAHRTSMLSSDCGACHLAAGRFPVSLNGPSTSAAPFNTACLGCHGRVEGAAGLTGRGLRQHHTRAGETACLACHGDAALTGFPVVAESVLPPLYLTGNAAHPLLPTDPCNPAPGFPEGKYGGSTLGLDNDGNGLYDVADPACTPTAPAINLSPSSLGFGNVNAGTTSPAQTSAIQNTGTAALTVTAIVRCAGTSAEFAFTAPATPFTVVAGGSANLSVTYAPTAAGADTGCIAVTSNASNSPTANLAVSGTGVAAPKIAVAPTSLSFGNVTVGSSGTQTFTISNTGNATLTGGVALASGTSTEFTPSPASFSIVAGGAAVTVTVSYAPNAVGSDSGSIVVSSNDITSPTVSVAVSGTGTAIPQPSIALVPSTLSFGTVTVGGSASLTTQVQNTGDAALNVTAITLGAGTSSEFSWSPAAPIAVPAGGSATVTVTYTPAAAGTDSGTIVFTSNAGTSPTSLSVTGAGQAAAAPGIAVSPTSLSFGNVTAGTTSAPQTFAISNTGTATLTGSVALAAGTSAEYTFSPASFSIVQGGAPVIVSVTYAPAAVGADTGSIVVSSNDTTNPTVSVAVSGTGTAVPQPSITLVPSTLSFGNVTLGNSSSLTTAVRNTGTAALTVSGIALCAGTSAEFTFTAPATPFSVAPGASASVTVTYTPADLGTDSGCIDFSSDDPASPTVSLGVTGAGVAEPFPAIAVSPLSLDFGTVTVGSSASRTTTIRNTGTGPLSVTSISLGSGTSAEFSWSPATPFAVAAGQSVTLTVTYRPIDATTDDGSIVIASDDPANPSVSVSVTGTGTPPAVGVDIDIVKLSVPHKVLRGAVIEPTAILKNTSTFDGSGTATLVGRTKHIQVYEQVIPVSLAAGQTGTFTFPPYTVGPKAKGTIHWTLTVQDEDPDVDRVTARTEVKRGLGRDHDDLGEDERGDDRGHDDLEEDERGDDRGHDLLGTTGQPIGGCATGGGSAGFLAVAALGLLAVRRKPRARRPGA